jgi:hypothetical protein
MQVSYQPSFICAVNPNQKSVAAEEKVLNDRKVVRQKIERGVKKFL